MEMISSSKNGKSSKNSSLMSIMRTWQSACDVSSNSLLDAEPSQYSISLCPGPQWWSWCPPCRNCSQTQQRGQQRHGQAYSIGALCTGVAASAWTRTFGGRQETLRGLHYVQDANYSRCGYSMGYDIVRPKTLHTSEQKYILSIRYWCDAMHACRSYLSFCLLLINCPLKFFTGLLQTSVKSVSSWFSLLFIFWYIVFSKIIFFSPRSW